MTRKLISSGSPMEPVIGFSRAVRVGQVIAVSRFIDPDWLVELEADAVVSDRADLGSSTRIMDKCAIR